MEKEREKGKNERSRRDTKRWRRDREKKEIGGRDKLRVWRG